MKLTPLDIKKQEFKRIMRGLDPDEVGTFLEMVAEEFETVLRERNRLEDEILKLRTQLQDYQNLEKTLKQTLVNAQETMVHSRENSKREANMLVREAELQAEKVIEEAKIKLAKLKNELLVVRAQKDSFARRLRHLLESQLELIGVLELDDLGFGHAEKRVLQAADLQARKQQQVKPSAPPARPMAREAAAPSRPASTMPGEAPEKQKIVGVGKGETPEQKITDRFVT